MEMFFTDCPKCGKAFMGLDDTCPHCNEPNQEMIERRKRSDERKGPPSAGPLQRKTEAAGFTRPEDGSGGRYADRRKRVSPRKHLFWWLVHNAVAHPAIAFVPVQATFEFHDWTSRKLHGH